MKIALALLVIYFVINYLYFFGTFEEMKPTYEEKRTGWFGILWGLILFVFCILVYTYR